MVAHNEKMALYLLDEHDIILKTHIKNKTGCRVVALGGSTTAGTETKEPYPKILEKLSKENCYVDSGI